MTEHQAVSRLSEVHRLLLLGVPLHLIVLTFITGMTLMFLLKIELARDKMHINGKAFLQIKMLRVFNVIILTIDFIIRSVLYIK